MHYLGFVKMATPGLLGFPKREPFYGPGFCRSRAVLLPNSGGNLKHRLQLRIITVFITLPDTEVSKFWPLIVPVI